MKVYQRVQYGLVSSHRTTQNAPATPRFQNAGLPWRVFLHFLGSAKCNWVVFLVCVSYLFGGRSIYIDLILQNAIGFWLLCAISNSFGGILPLFWNLSYIFSVPQNVNRFCLLPSFISWVKTIIPLALQKCKGVFVS